MSTRVYVNNMKGSHRETFWVTFENEHGETVTPHYFEQRERAVFTAAEYALFFGDMESYEKLKQELETTDPVMYKFLVTVQEKKSKNVQ